MIVIWSVISVQSTKQREKHWLRCTIINPRVHKHIQKILITMKSRYWKESGAGQKIEIFA